MPVSTLHEPPKPQSATVLNLPNALTMSRLVLAVVLFVLLAWEYFRSSFVVFSIAASTDWLDGYLARKRGETTVLGRILDPFVDKVVVIGAFIFLMPVPEAGLAAWMVTVVVARELLVTGLRSYLEGESIAFGADWMGKVKMGLQCVALSCVLFYIGFLLGPIASTFGSWGGEAIAWGEWISRTMTWSAVLVTALSGVSYCWRAIRLVRERRAG